MKTVKVFLHEIQSSLILSSLLLCFSLTKCRNFIFQQYISLKLILEIIAIRFIAIAIYDVSSLSLDRNHTFIGSDFPFIETGPLYSRRNCGS